MIRAAPMTAKNFSGTSQCKALRASHIRVHIDALGSSKTAGQIRGAQCRVSLRNRYPIVLRPGAT